MNWSGNIWKSSREHCQKHLLEQTCIDVVPSCRKEELPEILWQHVFLMRRNHFGDQPGQTIFGGVGFLALSLRQCLVLQRGGQLQPRLSNLQSPYENHSAIMEVQQADRNV